MCKALITLRADLILERGEAKLPDCLKNLRADMLFHIVCVQDKKSVAGAERFKQQGFSEIPLSTWTASLLDKLPSKRVCHQGCHRQGYDVLWLQRSRRFSVFNLF